MAIGVRNEALCASPANGRWRKVTDHDNSKTPMQLDESDYDLPAELVAQHPLKVRDPARMRMMGRARPSLGHAQVRDLVTLLTPQDGLVVNNTKVFPARLLGLR